MAQPPVGRRARIFRRHPSAPSRHTTGPPESAEDETILVVGQWQYIGRDHSPGEAIYARTIAQDVAENRRIARVATRNESQREQWPEATVERTCVDGDE